MRCRSLSRTSESLLGEHQLVVADAQVLGLGRGARVQPLGPLQQRAVLQRRRRLTGQDAQHRVVGVVDVPFRRRPRDEPADGASVEPDGDVQVPGTRVVLVVVMMAVTGVQPLHVPAHALGHRPQVGPLDPVRPENDVPRRGVGQLAVDEPEHHPVRRQVVGGRVGDRADQRLGTLHRADQRGRDPVQREDDPAQPLGPLTVLRVERRLARPQAGELVEVGAGPAPGGRRRGRCGCAAAREAGGGGHREGLRAGVTALPGTGSRSAPRSPCAGWWSGRRRRG